MKYLTPVKNFLRRGYIINGEDSIIQIHKEGIFSNKELPIKPRNFNWVLRRKINNYAKKNDVDEVVFVIGVKK